MPATYKKPTYSKNESDTIVSEASSNFGPVTFNGSTIVSAVTSAGEFMTITVNGSAYAVELNLY